MIINEANISSAFNGFKTVFQAAFDGTETYADKVSMRVPSATREETYGWLGKFPKLREWIGDRVLNSLEASSYAIKNKLFESTIEVSRTDFEDDQFGVLKPVVGEMGQNAKQHPDELIFSLLASGFSSLCYDGQNFFDADHPVLVNGEPVSISNVQAGEDAAWYLLDTSRQVKPVVFQERFPYNFQRLDQENSDHVFLKDQYLFGIRARANVGFGLWQLAFASKAPLNAENYEAARQAMMSMRADNPANAGGQGRVLGVKPTLLVVPPQLEGAARTLLNATVTNNDSNIWAGSAELIVTSYLL